MTSTSTPTPPSTPAPAPVNGAAGSGPVLPGLAATLLATPIATSSLGPIAAPAAGTGAVPPSQLAAQAASASAVLGLAPHDLAVTSQLTLEQLIAIVRQRLAQLESMKMLTSADVQHTLHTIDARRTGKPPLPPRGAPAPEPGQRGISVAGVVHQVAAGPHPPGVDFISIGDIFSGLLDLGATLFGGLAGGLIGGPAGAVMGAMTAHEWMQQQDFSSLG
jgi:hypothetical protein